MRYAIVLEPIRVLMAAPVRAEDPDRRSRSSRAGNRGPGPRTAAGSSSARASTSPTRSPATRGFVGWESPIRLANGDWLVGFNAGYWHASAPTPLRYPAKELEAYRKLGLPEGIVAPTGGRAMVTRSRDEGKTWSKPETLFDSPADDRHPAFVQLADGTILCSFFTYLGGEPRDKEAAPAVCFVRSFDDGRTWEKELRPLGTPGYYETDGPLVRMKDGSVLVAVNGRPNGPPDQAGFFRSTDRGETWQLLSSVKADHDLVEVTVAELPDGRLVMMARPEGDISWSRDRGRTWTPPVTFGMRMFAPSLTVLRDGTLVCLHGSYGKGGLRVIFSTDGGETWIAPAKDHGFLVDNSYGYGKPMELPDGSLFIAYIATGGHRAEDARTQRHPLHPPARAAGPLGHRPPAGAEPAGEIARCRSGR